MAVVVKYIVVRNGEEKMTFATKKEADAHDKMLDIADNLFDFFQTQHLELTENQSESIALILAENRDTIIPILKGSAGKKKNSAKSKQTASSKQEKTDTPAKGKPTKQ